MKFTIPFLSLSPIALSLSLKDIGKLRIVQLHSASMTPSQPEDFDNDCPILSIDLGHLCFNVIALPHNFQLILTFAYVSSMENNMLIKNCSGASTDR